MSIKEIAKHPMTFAVAAGIANGAIAAIRNKPISPKAAIITSLVVAAGEVALVMDVPVEDREVPMLDLGVLSVAGTLAGLLPFTEFQEGQGTFISKTGEYIGDKVSDATDRLLAAKRAYG